VSGDAAQLTVAVAGLGKIGVPLCVQFASKGARVTGYDINAARVARINAGEDPLHGEPGIAEALPELVRAGRLRATTDAREAAAGAGAVVLIVPVDTDDAHRPDFTSLDAATAALAPHVRRGSLLAVETTVPVGTTRYRVTPRIIEATGMTPGADFYVAFSPERVSSGSVLRDLERYPKVVGGIDPPSTERAVAFYRAVLDAEVLPVRDAETAEFTKLAETVYRDVNIALANELAMAADGLGVDVAQAIAAANSQPYSRIHDPGVGVGGHCIPVYPHFLASEQTALLNGARRINDAMAAYAVGRLREAVGTLDGATVVVLGLAYRAGVRESRHSSAFALVEALRADGAAPYVHDPLFSAQEMRALGVEPAPAFPLACDALVLQAWHAQYQALDFGAFSGLRAVLDGRGVLDPARLPGGVRYVAIGRP
jgi:nucleotide sugar dehydrogenase